MFITWHHTWDRTWRLYLRWHLRCTRSTFSHSFPIDYCEQSDYHRANAQRFALTKGEALRLNCGVCLTQLPLICVFALRFKWTHLPSTLQAWLEILVPLPSLLNKQWVCVYVCVCAHMCLSVPVCCGINQGFLHELIIRWCHLITHSYSYCNHYCESVTVLYRTMPVVRYLDWRLVLGAREPNDLPGG